MEWGEQGGNKKREEQRRERERKANMQLVIFIFCHAIPSVGLRSGENLNYQKPRCMEKAE